MVLEMFQVSEWEEGILRKPDSVRGADKKCSTGSHESGGGASGTGAGGSESAAVETPKYRKLTRQIEELLQIEEFSAEEIKTLLYERAMEQYQSAEIESRAYYGRKIEEILCRGGKQEYFNEKCFQKTVEKIMVFKNGTMDVHMKNGVVIQIKEDGGGKQ